MASVPTASRTPLRLRPPKIGIPARGRGAASFTARCMHAAASGVSAAVANKRYTPALPRTSAALPSQRAFASESNAEDSTALEVCPQQVVRERLCQLVPRYKDFGSEVIRRARERKQEEENSVLYNITVNKLMAAGLHFGNLKSKLNEGNLLFVFGVRHDLHIINLEMTIAHLRRAAHLLRETAMEGGTILFVGNDNYSKIATKCARDCNSYYLNQEFKTGMLAYPWDHLRKNNPREVERTVAAKDADNTVAYKLYQDDELKFHDWNSLLRDARAEFRRKKEAEGMDYAKVLEEAAENMRQEKAEYDKYMEHFPDPALRERWRVIRKVESPPITDEEVAWLMERMPDPDRPEDEVAAHQFAATYRIPMREAKRLLKEDLVREGQLIQEGILPDHIHYRLRSTKPIDPAADPTYDIEEDLYLRPEQIMQKKAQWIARAANKVVYEERQLPPHKPDVIIVFNVRDNSHLIREATECGIPTIAPVDTDLDPLEVTYPIPANDDNMRGIALIGHVFSHAIREGHQKAAELKVIGTQIAREQAARKAAIAQQRAESQL